MRSVAIQLRLIAAVAICSLGAAALAAGTNTGGGGPVADLPSYGAAAARTFIALIVVVALLLIAAKFLPRWLSRRPGPTGTGEIEIVASHAIEPRRRIYVVRVRGREYLIGSSELGLHPLSTGPLDARPVQTFAEVLGAKPGGAAVEHSTPAAKSG